MVSETYHLALVIKSFTHHFSYVLKNGCVKMGFPAEALMWDHNPLHRQQIKIV